MNYLTLFGGETFFKKLWLLLYLRAKLDLRLTNSIFDIARATHATLITPLVIGLCLCSTSFLNKIILVKKDVVLPNPEGRVGGELYEFCECIFLDSFYV